jgi:hypothetical protein
LRPLRRGTEALRRAQWKPWRTAALADGENAGIGFQSMSSGRIDLKADWPG